MTYSHGPLRCASCDSIVATISETGLSLPPSTTQEENCSTCDQVRLLYDAMKTADDVYASLSDRRDTYGPKQSAFVDVKRTHREFSNLLASVEKHTESNGEELSEKRSEPVDGAQADQKEDEHSSSKRPRSRSSNIMLDPAALPPEIPTDTSARHRHKRLKFSESVEFREDYRSSDAYARSNEAYVRGRYAAPNGSELLDTSGSDKSFIKFTGMKKVGKNWVDVWKDDSVEDTTVVQGHDGVGGAGHQGLVSRDATQRGQVLQDAHAQTSPRSKSTTVVVLHREDDVDKNGRGGIAKRLPGPSDREHCPSKAAEVDTKGFHQQCEEGDPKDLEQRNCKVEMGVGTSESGVCDPSAGKQDRTQGLVEHALVLGRSPHSQSPSLDHTSIAADGRSPSTTHTAVLEDPYNEQLALSFQDKRPTADENTTQAPLDATTPLAGQPNLTKPQNSDR